MAIISKILQEIPVLSFHCVGGEIENSKKLERKFGNLENWHRKI